jgi:hypothetical protein
LTSANCTQMDATKLTFDLQEPFEPSLVGTWLSTEEGTEVNSLRPIKPRFAFVMTLRADGSAEYRNVSSEWDHLEAATPPQLPTTWEVTKTGLLTISIPIAPMPEYEIFDWIYEAMRYDIIKIEPNSIILSNRACDGESTILLRREGFEGDVPDSRR